MKSAILLLLSSFCLSYGGVATQHWFDSLIQKGVFEFDDFSFSQDTGYKIYNDFYVDSRVWRPLSVLDKKRVIKMALSLAIKQGSFSYDMTIIDKFSNNILGFLVTYDGESLVDLYSPKMDFKIIIDQNLIDNSQNNFDKFYGRRQ